MQIDFDDVEPPTDFVSVPPGTYLCRIAEVQTGFTRNGDDRWGLRLVVSEGEYAGRLAAWDGLAFSKRGLPRAQKALEAMGIQAKGKIELEPDELVGREVFVVIREDKYDDPKTGQEITRNGVPYDGYMPVPEPGEGSREPPSGPKLLDPPPF